MSQHTRGPWIADEDGDIMTDGAMIAHVFDAADFPCYEAEDEANEQRFIAEMAANARLIAAAPDLLAACRLSQQVEEHYRFCPDCDQERGQWCAKGKEMSEQAEALRVAALAKAEGREPCDV